MMALPVEWLLTGLADLNIRIHAEDGHILHFRTVSPDVVFQEPAAAAICDRRLPYKNVNRMTADLSRDDRAHLRHPVLDMFKVRHASGDVIKGRGGAIVCPDDCSVARTALDDAPFAAPALIPGLFSTCVAAFARASGRRSEPEKVAS